MKSMKVRNQFQELASLFFVMRQIIRERLPAGHADPNGWMRCETLRYIAESDGPTMREIARRLRITAPSATSLIQNLERLGFIDRRPSQKDKRVVRIYLNERGKREFARYLVRSGATMEKVFSKLSARDVARLKRILQNLRDAHRI